MNPWAFALPIVLFAAVLVARAFVRRRRRHDMRIPRHKIDVSYRTGQFRR